MGLSDHTVGHTAALASIALGACVIEKHVILDRSIDSIDANFSLEVTQFAELVQTVRDCESAMGSSDFAQVDGEKRRGRRSLYVCRGVVAGETITTENVRSVRPGLGLHPRYQEEILGHKFASNVKAGTRCLWT